MYQGPISMPLPGGKVVKVRFFGVDLRQWPSQVLVAVSRGVLGVLVWPGGRLGSLSLRDPLR